MRTSAPDFNSLRSKDLKTGTPGAICQSADDDSQALPPEMLQETVQKIIDEAIASGAQSAVQCCVYLKGQCIVDAFGGVYDQEHPRKIDGDALFPIFSTEKPIFVTAIHRAVELGLLDYDEKIATYWPEFGCRGKENLTLRQLLSHRTGLSGSPLAGTRDEDVCNWDFMVRQCASLTPHLEPGTRSEYLGFTYAWLLGEPLSRVMKMPIQEALETLVLKPAQIQKSFYFALDDAAIARCVTAYEGVENYGYTQMNLDCYRRACIPSAYAAASARGLAQFYLRLTGEDGQPPLLQPTTLQQAIQPCRWEGEPIPDAETLHNNWQTIWGLGYGLWGHHDSLSRVIGQGGLGGCEAMVDLDRQLIVAYNCGISATACGKPYDLRPEIYRAVGMRTRYTK